MAFRVCRNAEVDDDGLTGFPALFPGVISSGFLALAKEHPGVYSPHSFCHLLHHRFLVLASAVDLEKSEFRPWPMPENIQNGMIFPEDFTLKLILITRISFQGFLCDARVRLAVPFLLFSQMGGI
jgi:hypothetical protein